MQGEKNVQILVWNLVCELQYSKRYWMTCYSRPDFGIRTWCALCPIKQDTGLRCSSCLVGMKTCRFQSCVFLFKKRLLDSGVWSKQNWGWERLMENWNIDRVQLFLHSLKQIYFSVSVKNKKLALANRCGMRGIKMKTNQTWVLNELLFLLILLTFATYFCIFFLIPYFMSKYTPQKAQLRIGHSCFKKPVPECRHTGDSLLNRSFILNSDILRRTLPDVTKDVLK